MVKKKKIDPVGPSQMASYPCNNNLPQRNQALLYVLGGFAVLLYVISFVRMGQW